MEGGGVGKAGSLRWGWGGVHGGGCAYRGVCGDPGANVGCNVDGEKEGWIGGGRVSISGGIGASEGRRGGAIGDGGGGECATEVSWSGEGVEWRRREREEQVGGGGKGGRQMTVAEL